MNPGASADTAAAGRAWLEARRARGAHSVRLTIGLSLAGGLLLIAQAWLVALTIDAVLFDDAGVAEVAAWLWWVPVLIGARALLAWAATQTAFRAAARIRVALRAELLQHLARLGPVRLGQERTGELVTLAGDGIEALEGYYARYLPGVALSVLLPLAILALVLPLDWLSAVVLLLTAPLIPLFMVLVGKGTERLNQRQWRRLARLSAHFLDVIQGLKTLKLFNASRREVTRIVEIADTYRHSTMAVLRVAFLSSLALEFFATVSIAVIAVSIGFRLLWGEMDFLHGFFILLLAPEFYLPLRQMGTHYHDRLDALGSAEHLRRVLDIPVPATARGTAAAPDLRSAPIRFDAVEVVYAGERRALDGVTLTLKPGERVAIVGPSGAGKSTLLNLLLGFVDASAGQVSVGERPLADIDPGAWRSQIAWVPQRPHLYAASAEDNIRLARPAATADELRAAIAQADAGFLFDLPDGLATPIGEGGSGLSGGQAQRVALARAFLRRAPLTLLDEPTAGLDRATERAVQRAIDGLAAHGTVVVIAHRLDTVRRVGRILLFDQGRLRADGDHAGLLASDALYRRLVADFGGPG
jgi:ATP-binding cassette subfamily C protein CydD